MATIHSWLTEFIQIRSAINLVLQLVRNSAQPLEKEAKQGFYQEMLDPQNNLRMIRIILKLNCEAFPEISVGRHFLSVRFFNPTIETRPCQYKENLNFWIAYCNSGTNA
jgi:cell division protein ZapD